MRELVYYVATSLDGRIAAPDGDFSAFPVEGDHIEWIFRDYRDTLPAPALAATGLTADRSRFSTVLMGWHTYAAGFPQGVRDPYPHLEQVVVSARHAGEEIPANIRVVTDDPVAEVRRLKREAGSGIWLCGGGTLAAALADEIDRLVLKVNPVVLGDGIPLFAGGPGPRHLDLVDSTRFSSGVVVSEYAPR
jgi:dihydrofolate reductase